MTTKSIAGSNESLFLSRSRNNIVWCSGLFQEPSKFGKSIVFVSIVFLNRRKQIGERISLMALN
jgi:hypothetical protein